MVVELADAFPCDITEDHLLRVARIFDEDGSGYVEQGERCPGYRAQVHRTYANIIACNRLRSSTHWCGSAS